MRSAAAERWSPILAGCFLALPLFVARGAPMSDLPLHEGMISLLVRHGDPSFTRGLYVLNWGHANQLFYVLALPIAFALGSDLACRAVVAATLVATFVASARLCDHLRASRWAALLVAPAAMGWTFFQGFAPNMLGLAIFLFALPALDRVAQTPTWPRASGACAIILLLHAAHEVGVICACAAIAVLSLGRRADVREWCLRAAPIALAAALSWIEIRIERPVLTGFGRGWQEAGIETHPIAKKLEYAGDYLMGPQGVIEEALVATLVAAAVAAFVVGCRRDLARADGESALAGFRFELLAVAFCVVYLAAPYAINFGAFLYVRFLTPAYVIGVLVLARRRRASVAAIVLCAAVPLAWVIVVLPEFARADQERRDVNSLLPRIDEGSAVAVLGLGLQGGVTPSNPVAQGNRVLAVRGGRALHSFTEYPIAPVLVRNGVRWDEPMLRVYRSPVSLRPGWDLTRFRYLLLRIPEPVRGSLVARALVPDARLVAQEGAWWLLESTHAMSPIDAPDAPLPVPPPPTIQERVSSVLAAPP